MQLVNYDIKHANNAYGQTWSKTLKSSLPIYSAIWPNLIYPRPKFDLPVCPKIQLAQKIA